LDSSSIPTPLLYLAPAVVSFVICAAMLPPYIKKLRDLHVEQYLREEGPKSHAGKAKTPTAGGVCFWLAIVITALGCQIFDLIGRIYISKTIAVIYAPLFTVLFFASICWALGLWDDLAKVQQKANKGISEKLRLSVEAVTGLCLGLILVGLGATFRQMAEPQMVTSLGNLALPQMIASGTPLAHLVVALQPNGVPWYITILIATFLIPATTNAVNLHDGMDGLAGGTSFLVLVTMGIIFGVSDQRDLAVLCSIAAGALFAFLLFNKYPAKIFMGDTGSLFLGGLIGALGATGGILIWFVPLTLIYILEALSVMAQVSYFKLTKPYTPDKPMSQAKLIWTKMTKRLPGEGKRIFRMAPLHHHFEAVMGEKGVREWQIVLGFWCVQAIICLIVLVAFFSTRPPH
jgi:phospho-N-acetylmuramoyl-pentapeptide-transferase